MAFAVFSFSVSPAITVGNPIPPPNGFPWDDLILTDPATGDLILPDGIPVGDLDCTRTAINRIWKQFESQPNWLSLFTLYGGLGDQLEARMKSIDESRYVSTAEGVQLDLIGEMVRRPRNGLDDDDYRLAIIAETVSLFSSGTIPDILAVIEALLGEGAGVVFTEKFPASWVLCIPSLTPDFFNLLLEILADQPAAGVAATLCSFDPLKVGGRRSSAGSGGGLLGSRTSSAGPGTNFPPISLFHHGQGI